MTKSAEPTDRMLPSTSHFGLRHASLAILLMGCGDPEPRPQWVLELDTDAPLTGQLLGQPMLPAVVAIDTLRIDLLADDGSLVETREATAPDARDWPMSFGVVVDDDAARLRIRAFRGQDAVPDGEGQLLPPPRQTIDRLVVLEPADEKRERRVLLSLACLGRPPSFVSPERSCVDEARPDAPANEGLVEVGAPSAAGTAPWLEVLDCIAEPPAGAVCVPGGIDVIGDAFLSGVADLLTLDAAPPVSVRLSPMFMDRFEVSVAEVRALYADGSLTATEPLLRDPGNPDQEHCNWLAPDDDSRDAHPINCVAVSTADAICAARGGRLPTEAEWEHAARGRGRGIARPWGNDDPLCCATHAGYPLCDHVVGTAEVDAYAAPPACPFGDQSDDGIVGLTGNVSEITRDAAEDYAGPCWQYDGVPLDPSCTSVDGSRAARGGSWNNSLTLTHAAFRLRYVPSAGNGLRCVYDDIGGTP
jgi:formylglycine-generating enzyme required for sulfatase activity